MSRVIVHELQKLDAKQRGCADDAAASSTQLPDDDVHTLLNGTLI